MPWRRRGMVVGLGLVCLGPLLSRVDGWVGLAPLAVSGLGALLAAICGVVAVVRAVRGGDRDPRWLLIAGVALAPLAVLAAVALQPSSGAGNQARWTGASPGAPDGLLSRAAHVCRELGATALVEDGARGEVRCIVRSALFRFPDDVVISVREGQVVVTSASRIGTLDFGVNQARVEVIAERLGFPR